MQIPIDLPSRNKIIITFLFRIIWNGRVERQIAELVVTVRVLAQEVRVQPVARPSPSNIRRRVNNQQIILLMFLVWLFALFICTRDLQVRFCGNEPVEAGAHDYDLRHIGVG